MSSDNCSSAIASNGSHPAMKSERYDGQSYDTMSLSPVDGVESLSAELKEWNVRCNPVIESCGNRIRQFVDTFTKSGDPGENFISLAQGDPVRFGPHMKVPEAANSAVIKVIEEAKNNSYPHSSGLLETRRALAEYLSVDGPAKLSPQNVTLTCGAGQAIRVAIDAFRCPGCNILLPRPGFSSYEALCNYYNVECRFYDILEGKNWEIDLDQVATLADNNTVAMIVCNPGNPAGSVFSYQHLAQIATLAGKLKVSVISDEVYAKMVFGKTPFVSMAMFSDMVPVLAIGSVSKGWLATGWRLGWLAIWDPHQILKKAKILDTVMSIMQLSSSPSAPIQAALPEMLKTTPATHYEKTCEHLRSGAELCYTRANKCQGLSVPTRPEGSMFMLVKLDLAAFKDINSDSEFTQALLKEESVCVMPGVVFGIPNWIRIVFALSLPDLRSAWDRIEKFCVRHTHQP